MKIVWRNQIRIWGTEVGLVGLTD